MATEEIQLPASGLRFRDLVQFINLSPEEFLAACPNPFLLEVPVEQPEATPKRKPLRVTATQKFKALTPEQLKGDSDVDPTMIVQPEDIVKLVRSRSGDAAKKVLIHMISPHTEGSEVVILGRDEDCDVHIDLPTVSKRHAELSHLQDSLWQLKDLGSLNGTIVDGQPVPGGTRAVLRDRGDVRFGSYQAIFLTSKTLYKLIQRLKASTAS